MLRHVGFVNSKNFLNTPSSSTEPLTIRYYQKDIDKEILEITSFISNHFPDEVLRNVNLTSLHSLITQAYESSDLDMDIAAAIKWGDGFTFPPQCFTSDMFDLDACHGDLGTLIKKRQSDMSHRRLNESCIQKISKMIHTDDPDLALLQSLVNGIPVVVDQEFVADPFPPSPSPLYVQAACAVNRMWYDLYLKGFVLLLPTAQLKKWHLIRHFNLSYSRAGWAKKRGAAKGRPTNNHSYDNKRGGLINTKGAKNTLKNLYGDIHPAQLNNIVSMILGQAEKHGWDNIISWKMDLMGAYNLLFFKAEDAGLLAMELSDKLTMVSMVGHFGWVGTPYAFDVVSRILVKLIRMRIAGDVDIATDDLMGCCSKSDAQIDMDAAFTSIHDIFVADCVNDKKTELGLVIDVIGWNIDLVNRTVGVAKHNLLKALHGFMTVRLGDHLSIRHFMKLASWASRYSIICRYMKPFTHYLYSISTGMKNLDATKRVTSPIYQIVRLWVMFLVLANLEPQSFSRSILSFGPQAETLTCNIDASLEGIGILLYQTAGSSRKLIAVVGFKTPYALNHDSSFQNTMEFIAVVSTIFLCVHLGYRDTGLRLESDSTSSISWTSRESFKSERALSAACIYIPLMIKSGLVITEADHIAGTSMLLSDPLSRGTSPEDLGFDSSVVVDLSRVPTFVKIINMMDPVECTGNFGDDNDHIQTRWKSAITLVEEALLPSRKLAKSI